MFALYNWWISKVGYWTVTYSKGFMTWYEMCVWYIGFNALIYVLLRLWKKK